MPDRQEPIISVSGLRGVIGASLTPEVVLRFAAAYAQEQPPGPLLVTRDGRPSGAMLVDAVRAALCACGRKVIDAGIAATPTAGVLIRQMKAAGGVQVTASHNPPEYNGLKLFDAQGRVLSAALGERVLERYRQSQPGWADHEQTGSIAETPPDPARYHLDLVLKTVDVAAIRARNFSVLLDSNHGSGSLLGRRLLEALGCHLTVLGETPDGRFAHAAEPTEENLATVGPAVRDAQAAVGFCQDPDADRLALIDERGHYVGEEYTLALCLDHVLRKHSAAGAHVVTNCATSRMCEDVAKRHGAVLHRSPVGEAHVVAAMLEHDAVFGGEGNGGPIDPRVGYIRDSFVGMAQILDALAARQLPLSRLADELPRYHIRKVKVPLRERPVAELFDDLAAHFHDARADRRDGLRLDWPDRWLLIRPSNTEPIVRIIAEAANPEQAADMTEAARRQLGG